LVREPGSTRRAFVLRKWYLDVVADDGATAIAYRAALRWGLIRARYASVLSCGAGGPVESSTTWRGVDRPDRGRGVVTWSAPPIALLGRWLCVDPEHEQMLLDSPSGLVRWTCLAPRARATVRVNGRQITGWGYVERLDLTIRPWQLPLDELLWGRFGSGDGGVVWIRWRGQEPRTIILFNGAPVEGEITDEAVRWDGGELHLDPGRTLRRGRLGSTVLSAAPLLRRLAPRMIRNLREHKILSRAELRTRDGTGTGWAIHEVVTFREPSA
jgi:hypothetical protein